MDEKTHLKHKLLQPLITLSACHRHFSFLRFETSLILSHLSCEQTFVKLLTRNGWNKDKKKKRNSKHRKADVGHRSVADVSHDST